MGATVDTLTDRKILIMVSNPSTSEQTGWPIGFWWAELSHPYWEFTEHGYQVEIASPDGGALKADPVERPARCVGLLRRGPDHSRFRKLSQPRSAGRGVQGAGRGVSR
jgi:putative intracellular protease/amidase